MRREGQRGQGNVIKGSASRDVRRFTQITSTRVKNNLKANTIEEDQNTLARNASTDSVQRLLQAKVIDKQRKRTSEYPSQICGTLKCNLRALHNVIPKESFDKILKEECDIITKANRKRENKGLMDRSYDNVQAVFNKYAGENKGRYFIFIFTHLLGDCARS